TAMTHEIGIVADLAGAIKAALPQATIVVGGVHPTALPLETLRDFPTFDLAVFGEGEATLVELAQGAEWAHIAGLAWRRDNEVVVNEPRPWLTADELNALPYPAWDLFPPAHTYPMLTTRGCPFTCIFCARPYGNRVRGRTVDNILGEFRWLLDDFKPGYIKVYDETFGVNQRHTAQVLDGLIDMGLPGRVRWWAQTRISVADEALLEHMARAGCDYVGLGIESGNAQILSTIAKDIDLDKARRLVRAAQRAGITTEGFYIIGLPHETRETAWDTIRFAADLNTEFVSIGLMVPYPHTEVYEMARRGEGGYRLISTDWRDFNKQLGNALELNTLSRAEMERLQLVGYSYFFLRNLRIPDFVRFCWTNRREAWAFVRQFVPKLLGRRGAAVPPLNTAQPGGEQI
ncbi:MAG: B12-binding domain-containing radical SAM protein, partial [Chloroflexi bacterium]|nr:B12-binding domain-containing radical SAM protein [Chloroflexota bacterium]